MILDVSDNINPAVKTYLRNDILREGVNDDTIGLALALDDSSSVFSSTVHQSSAGTGVSKARGAWQLQNMQSESQLIHQSHDRVAGHSGANDSKNMQVNSNTSDFNETQINRHSNSIAVHVNSYSGNLFSNVGHSNDEIIGEKELSNNSTTNKHNASKDVKNSVQNTKRSKYYQGGVLEDHLKSKEMVDDSSMNEMYHDNNLHSTTKKMNMKRKPAIDSNNVDFGTLFKAEAIITECTLKNISEYTKAPVIVIKEKIVEKNPEKKKVSKKILKKEKHYMNINEDEAIFESNNKKQKDLSKKTNADEDSVKTTIKKFLSMKKKKKKQLLEKIQHKISDSQNIEDRTKYEKIYKLINDSLSNKTA